MSRIARLRAVPWLIVFEAARAAHTHLMDVTSPSDRRRVKDIVASAKGNPANVSPRDREELRRIAKKVDLGQLAREIGPGLMMGSRRRRRW